MSVLSRPWVRWSLLAASVAISLRPEPVAAQKTGSPALPPPLTAYKGREIATTMHYSGAPWLIRDNREQ